MCPVFERSVVVRPVLPRRVLKPGLRRLWRDGSTLQLGVDSSRALVVPDVTPAHAAALAALAAAGTAGPPAATDPAMTELLELLDAAGLLDDGPLDDLSPADGTYPGPAERDRLRPDLAAVSLATADPSGARRTLARRRAARVRVQGAGRVGAAAGQRPASAGRVRRGQRDGGEVGS